MTFTDSVYCGAVAGPDADACTRWLQAGRDHRWAPPAPAQAASLLVPIAALLLTAAALIVAALWLRRTRRPGQAALNPPWPGAVPTLSHGSAPAGRWHDSDPPGWDSRTDAHSTAGPA